jgi:asparagine synthase (glutamine-hydrolysing)
MRRTVVVALEGQGSDELFGGYVDTLLPYALADDLKRAAPGEAIGHLRDYIEDWGLWNATAWTARSVMPWSHKWFRRWRGDESVYTDLLQVGDGVAGPDSDLRFGDAITAKLHEQHTRGLRTLLHYGDAVSMAHSVESRLPFLDYRLVELGFRLPGRFKVRGARGKLVLKEAVQKEVPASILLTPKLGFATPIAHWFRTEPESTIYPVLRSERCRGRGLFNMPALERAVDRHITGKVDLSSQIFRWITTEIWLQRFIDGD